MLVVLLVTQTARNFRLEEQAVSQCSAKATPGFECIGKFTCERILGKPGHKTSPLEPVDGAALARPHYIGTWDADLMQAEKSMCRALSIIGIAVAAILFCYFIYIYVDTVVEDI